MTGDALVGLVYYFGYKSLHHRQFDVPNNNGSTHTWEDEAGRVSSGTTVDSR